MALSLYMDVHIPAAITDGLRRKGVDILTSQEDQSRTAADEELLGRATALGRLLFTYDADFLTISTAWQRVGKHFSGILFVAQRGPSIGRIISDIHLIAEVCTAQEVADQVIFLPLK